MHHLSRRCVNLLVVASCAFALAACGDPPDDDNGDDNNANQTTNNDNGDNDDNDDNGAELPGEAKIDIGDDCSVEPDPDTFFATLHVVSISEIEDEDSAFLFDSSDADNNFRVDVAANLLEDLGSPPEDDSYRLDGPELLIQAIQVGCEGENIILSNDDDEATEDLEDIDHFEMSIEGWELEQSFEADSDDCSGDADACRISHGTTAVELDLAFTSPAGEDVEAYIDIDGVDTQWFEDL